MAISSSPVIRPGTAQRPTRGARPGSSLGPNRPSLGARPVSGVTPLEIPATSGPPRETKDDNNILEFIDKLSVPLYATVGLAESLTGKGEKRNVIANIKNNVAQKEGWASYLRKWGVEDKTAAGAGFALDLVVDPLNLLGFGLIGKGAKAAGYIAALDKTADLKKISGLARTAAKSQVKQESKSLLRQQRKFTKVTQTADETVPEMMHIIDRSQKIANKLRKSKNFADDAQELTKISQDLSEAAKKMKQDPFSFYDKPSTLIDAPLANLQKIIGKRETLIESALKALKRPKSQKDLQLLAAKFLGKEKGKAVGTFLDKARDAVKYVPSPDDKILARLLKSGETIKSTYFKTRGDFEKELNSVRETISKADARGDIVESAQNTIFEMKLVDALSTLSKEYGKNIDEIEKAIRNERGNVRWLHNAMRGKTGEQMVRNAARRNPEVFSKVHEKKLDAKQLVSDIVFKPATVFRQATFGAKGARGILDNVFNEYSKIRTKYKIDKDKIPEFKKSERLSRKLRDENIAEGAAAPIKGLDKIDDAFEKMFVANPVAMQKAAKFVNTVMKSYARVLRLFKVGKTVLNPGAHPRNTLTNVIFTAWDKRAANPLDPKWLHAMRDAIKIYYQGAKAAPGSELNKAFEFFDTSFDIRQGSTSLARDITSLDSVALSKVSQPGKEALDKIKSVYGSEDTVFKIAHVLYRIDPKYQFTAGSLGRKFGGQKMSFVPDQVEKTAKAIAEANEIYLNYAAMPQFAQFMRDIPFGSPFISFWYGFMHKFGKQLVTDPAAIQIPVKAKQAIAEIKPISEEEQAAMDKYRDFLNSPRFGKIPFFEKYDPITGKKTSYMFDYFAYFPHYSMAKYNEEGIDLPIFDNPFVSIPRDLLKNEDFIGRDIIPKGASDAEKIEASTGYISNQLLPAFFPTVNKKYGVGGYFWDAMEKEKEKKYGNRVRRIMASIGFPVQEMFFWGDDK